MNQNKPRRPFSLFVLILLVLFFTVFSLARAVQAALIWEALTAFAEVPPLYLLLSGVIWMMIGLGLALGLWRGWRNAWLGTLPVFILYSIYAWIDRLALPGYAARNQNWPFMLAVNLLILAGTAWIVSRQRFKTFFGEMHEQPTPEQPTRPEQLSGEADLTIEPGGAEYEAAESSDL